jgi:hypothetical protein
MPRDINSTRPVHVAFGALEWRRLSAARSTRTSLYIAARCLDCDPSSVIVNEIPQGLRAARRVRARAFVSDGRPLVDSFIEGM